MIGGHLAFAVIAKRPFFQAESFPLLIFASYAPDLMNKTASMALGLPGRNYGHSLVLFWPLLTPITGEPFHLGRVMHSMHTEFHWPGQLALESCLITLALAPLPILERIGALRPLRVFVDDKSARP
jgi:hypothetical protein